MAAVLEEIVEPAPSEEKNTAAAALELPPVHIVVAERYERLENLGKGLFGEVYKALDRVSKRFVAVKRLSGRTDDDFVKTPPRYFEQEVTSLVACQGHPNVVRLLDAYADCSRDDGDSFVVTEYAGPMNLREYMNSRRRGNRRLPFDEAEVRDIMEQLLAGARHIHKAGVLHRDIVPENVVVDWDAASGRMVCKICGFGASKPLAQADMDGSGMHATSRWYRAPELFLGSNKDYDDRVDTWSLGCIMADLVAGDTEPYLEWVMLERAVPPAQVALMLQKAARRGSFPREQVLLLSAAGFKVLKRLLETNPDRRLSAAATLRKPWFPLTARIKHLCAA